MSEKLELYKNITPPDSQITCILANMFAAIERQCTKVMDYDGNTTNKRANQATGVFDRFGHGDSKTPRKECRDGHDCKRGGCHFSHPERQVERTEGQQTKRRQLKQDWRQGGLGLFTLVLCIR